VTQPTLRLDSPDGAWISFDPGTETAKLQSAAAVTLGVANIWTLSVWAYVRAATAGTFFATLPATGFQNRILLQIDSAHGSLYPEGEIAVTLSDNTAGTPLVLRRRRYSTPAIGWIHLAVTWDGSALLFYRNGLLEPHISIRAEDTAAIGQIDQARTVAVGGTQGGSLFLDGGVHSIALWNVALGALEIAELDQGGHALVPLERNFGAYQSAAALKHWWRIGQGKGSVGAGGALVVDRVASGGIDLEGAMQAITDYDDRMIFSGAPIGRSLELVSGALYSVPPTTLGIANQWTIAFALKPIAYEGVLWRISSGASNFIEMSRDAAGAMRVQINSSAGAILKVYDYTAALPSGEWRSIAITWSGAALSVYSNAAALTPIKSTDVSGTMTDTSRVIRLAYSGSGSVRFASLAFWNRVLSAAEAREVAVGRTAMNLRVDRYGYAGGGEIVHWFKFGEDAGSIGTDYAGSAPFSSGQSPLNLRGDAP